MWLWVSVLIVLALLGFLVPLLVPSTVVPGSVTGAWGGALIAGAGAMLGILISTLQSRRDAEAAHAAQRRQVKAVIVSEMNTMAKRLSTLKRAVDRALTGAPRDQVVVLGRIREKLVGSMPMTRSVVPQISILPEADVSAITEFLSDLDLFLSDFHELLSPNGRIPYQRAMFLQMRLAFLCGGLAALFEVLAPDHSVHFPPDQPEPASRHLGRLSEVPLMGDLPPTDQ